MYSPWGQIEVHFLPLPLHFGFLLSKLDISALPGLAFSEEIPLPLAAFIVHGAVVHAPMIYALIHRLAV